MKPIRPATLQDIPRLVALGAVMHAESRYARMRYNSAKLEQMLRLVLERGFLMIAEREGEVIGGFAGVCEPHWFSDDLIATDLGLFVEPGKRGGLAAYWLVDAFLTWANERGASIIDILVNTGVRTEQTTELLKRLGGRVAGNVVTWGNF